MGFAYNNEYLKIKVRNIFRIAHLFGIPIIETDTLIGSYTSAVLLKATHRAETALVTLASACERVSNICLGTP